MITALLIVLAAFVLGAFHGAGRAAERRRLRRLGVTPEQAWDNGCQHGLRAALHTVEAFPKPYITSREELGWIRARKDLAAAIRLALPEGERS